MEKGAKMKKLTVVLLLAALVLGTAFASGMTEKTGMQKVIILNSAFDGLEMTDQCFNAKEYHKAYNLGEIIDANFWFTPDSGASAETVAFTDFYTDSTSLKIFRQKFVSFMKDNPAFDYDLFVGQQQKESYDVKYKGYCVIDKEGLVFVPTDGWNVAELLDSIKMAKADAYEFVSATGESVVLSASELDGEEIVLHGLDCADLAGEKTLDALQYIIPQGLTKDSTPADEGVSRLTVLLCAKGVFKTEAPYMENRAGTFYKAWAVKDLLSKYNITPCGEVEVISWKDGYSQKEDYSLFAKKYIAFQAPTAKGDQKDFFTLGKAQQRNGGVNNAGYYIFEQEAFAYIPETGLLLGDVFKTVGMDGAFYMLTYSDGMERVIKAERAETMVLTPEMQVVSISVFI